MNADPRNVRDMLLEAGYSRVDVEHMLRASSPAGRRERLERRIMKRALLRIEIVTEDGPCPRCINGLVPEDAQGGIDQPPECRDCGGSGIRWLDPIHEASVAMLAVQARDKKFVLPKSGRAVFRRDQATARLQMQEVRLQRAGETHTNRCWARIAWGDGACECGTVLTLKSETGASTPHPEVETALQAGCSICKLTSCDCEASIDEDDAEQTDPDREAFCVQCGTVIDPNEALCNDCLF